MNIEAQIRLLQASTFEPPEPDTETRYPGLIIISLSIIAWAAVGGIGYAVYQAVASLIS